MLDVRYSRFGVKWLFLLFGLMQLAQAQTQTLDSLRVRALADTVKTTILPDTAQKKKPKTPAQIAFRRSLMIPAWGQVYNKQLWLVPVIYAAAGVSVGYLISFDEKYHETKRAYLDAVEKNTKIKPPNSDYEYTAEQLRFIKNGYRRYRDLNYIGLVLGWGLQAVQANVQAHLRTFDSGNDLSLKIEPVLTGGVTGLGIVVRF